MSVDIGVPTLHPSLGRIAEGSYQFIAGYRPGNPRDLHQYLASQGAAMNILGTIYQQFGDRMTATFPGFNLVHGFFHQVAQGYSSLEGQANEVFQGWEALHSADLARFKDPRVNEHYADVVARGIHVDQVPRLEDGTLWHANHTIMIDITRDAIGNLEFGGVDSDRVSELVGWLGNLPDFFDCLARHTVAMGTYLVSNLPVNPNLHEFYKMLGRGYLGLADQAEELCKGYAQRNAPDVQRRAQPRTNEQWFDVGNVAANA